MNILILNVTFAYFLQPSSGLPDDVCWTPDQKRGSCVFLHQCHHLNSMLKNLSTNRTIADHLTQFICEFVGKDAKVCCVPEVHDVTHHLLPNKEVCGKYNKLKLYTQYALTGQYPWNALLVYENDTFLCAGTLISDRYVLTAAHCVKEPYLPNEIKLKKVRLGENNLLTNPDCDGECAEPYVEVGVEKIIVHENFNGDSREKHDDIALIRLNRNVSFTFDVAPVCLPSKSIQVDKYEESAGAGWGIYRNSRRTSVKRRIYAEIRNNSLCNGLFQVQLNENQVCFGNRRMSYYADDSGGGMFSYTSDFPNYFINGIMSFGASHVNDSLRVYTKVENYVDWIISKLEP